VFSNLQPEHDGGEVKHGEVVSGALFVAGGDAPALFETTEQALDLVALGIGLPVDQGARVLALGLRDDAADAAPAQVVAHVSVAVAAVGHQPLWPLAWPAWSGPADPPAIQQMRQGLVVGRLAAGQVEDERPAVAIAADMDLGGEPAAAPAECFVLLPPFAPAACWCARITVLST